MKKIFANFNRIFGSGPAGLLISIMLFYLANSFKDRINLPSISNSRFILNSIFTASALITLAVIVWSLKSLPASARGNRLTTTGAFRYVRHPLYAAFLSVFNFGLAVYLNNYIFVLWAILLHPVWHRVIRYEERQMVNAFGDAYLEYEKNTGRFFPRLYKK